MNSIQRISLGLLVAAAMTSPAALAKGDKDKKADSHHDHHSHHEDHDDDRNEDRDRHQGSWKGKNALPPGLQKKVERGGELPPGWQDKLQVGRTIEPDIYHHGEVLGPVDEQGRVSIRLGDRTVRVIEATREIVDIFSGTR